MEQKLQDDREQGNELQELNSYSARDFKRWTTLFNKLRTIALTTKQNMQIQATNFAKASPSEQQKLQQKIFEIAGSTDDLVEAEAYLLLKGVQSIAFDEIATTTNEIYLFFMGLTLEAGELAVQRLQAAMEDYQSQRLSESSQGAESEAGNLSEQQSTKAVSVTITKEES
jgi:hypothetical protein